MAENTIVVGREDELARVSSFLDAVPHGPSALFLEGEAGIGKTTVWAEAIRLGGARSYTVLAARPSQSEAKLSFTALGDLTEETLDEALPSLPLPQRRALQVALLREEVQGRAPEQRTVSVAFVSVLRALAARVSVVIAVDDLQWLDAPTARVLEFALRRLRDEPVSLLASVRVPAPRSSYLEVDRILPTDRVDRLTIVPLSLGAIQRMLRDASLSFSRPTIRRLYEVCGGNPFYALEIARALQRQGAEPAPDEPMPIPDHLQGLIRDRLEALPPRSRRSLVVASALSQPTVETVARAMDRSDRVSRDLLPAVHAEVVRFDGGRIRFTHPLLASVCYASASAEERRGVHRRIAAVLDDPEERARHFALAADAPDQSVANALEVAARAAFDRGATVGAAELSELACRFTPPDRPDDLRRRRLTLGECQFVLGAFDAARRQLEDLAHATPQGAERARVLLLLAFVMYQEEGPPEAVRVAEQAIAEAGGDRILAASGHVLLTELVQPRPEPMARHATAALRLLGDDESADGLRSAALMALARARSMAGEGIQIEAMERAVTLMERAARLGQLDATPFVATPAKDILAYCLKYADHFDRSRDLLEEMHRASVDLGDDQSLPLVLAHLAQLECWAGNLSLAARYAQEGLEMARTLEGLGWLPMNLTMQALVHAVLGETSSARAEADEGRTIAERSGSRVWVQSNLNVLGFLDLSESRPESAERNFSLADAVVDELGLKEPALSIFRADRIEALIALGEFEHAELLLESWEAYGRRADRAWALATGARCRGLLRATRGDVEGAAAAIREALLHHERLPMPLELGRTFLVKGQIERRARRKRASKDSLERALAIFEMLPAPLWGQKARAELRRVGLRPPAPLELTPTEERVADLIAQGLTNRQVAEALFMSPRTVESNLARVYRKLGVSSRAQLATAIAIGARPGP